MTARVDSSPSGRLRLPFWAVLCAFLAIALFFLWSEHRAHLLGALPYALLLLCPMLHLFHGHGGHGGHGNHGGHVMQGDASAHERPTSGTATVADDEEKRP